MTQIAFVSGSSRGIGRACALELARRGFAVAVNGRAESAAMEKTCSDIAALGVPVAAIPGDMADLSRLGNLLDAAEEQLGPLTTLVCNAGVPPLVRADILEATAESLDHCLRINTAAPFFLLQNFANRVLARPRDPAAHYSAVVISSASAVAASLNKADYCISKAGAAMVAKTFALKLAPEGIQVVDIQPGVIETEMSAPVVPDYRRRIQAGEITIEPRTGQPEDVAKAVGAVAGGDLPYLAGAVLTVDGGLSLARL